MASTFDTLWPTQAAVLGGMFGDAGTYNPPAGSGGSVVSGLRLMLDRSPAHAIITEADAELQTVEATIHVSQAALPSPAIDGWFSFQGHNWAIVDTPMALAGMWLCAVQAMDRVAVNERREGGR